VFPTTTNCEDRIDAPTPALPANGEGVRWRKEFFRIDIETIRALVEEHHGVVEYVADPEALQYRESLTISAEDQEFIERVYEAELPEEEVDEAVEEL
jgi:hypothetical protein